LPNPDKDTKLYALIITNAPTVNHTLFEQVLPIFFALYTEPKIAPATEAKIKIGIYDVSK